MTTFIETAVRKRNQRQISVRGDTHASIKAVAGKMGLTVGRLVDQIITDSLDREAEQSG